MSILEPEPERTLSQSNLQKISIALAEVLNKLSDYNVKNKDFKVLNFKKDKEAEVDNNSEEKNSPKVNEKIVREIMTSRKDTFTINIEDDIDSILDSLVSIDHSKVPVYEKNIDNIIGILYIKDLLIKARQKEINNIDIIEMLHTPQYIPETKEVNELYDSVKSKTEDLFILVDEYGGFAGIVTIEDLTYEIKGVTSDKRLKKSKIIRLDENNFMVKGYLTINDFNKIFKMNIKQKDYDTLSGYVIDKLGQIPEKDENIELDLGNLMLKLIKVNNRRIEDIQISIAN